jgi:hypothetical protein
VLHSHYEFIPLIAVCVVLMAWHPRRTIAVVVDYFRAKSSPLNLAVFRVALFGSILLSILVFDDPKRTEGEWFAGLPPELIVTPTGARFVLNQLRLAPAAILNPIAVRITMWFFLVSCATGLVGIFSRTSASVATLSGLYALGAAQFYGKVDHYHHWLWFAAILAVSPCGDTLSLDSAIRRRPLPPAAICYALPLRFVWLLMGLLYFFAGFWKLWDCGHTWFSSDNLTNMMRATWLENGLGEPFSPLLHYPLLYKIGGLFTILFEMSFIVLIFLPRWRWLAPVGGILFHLSTWASVGIFFWDLLVLYAAFVDWAFLLRIRPGEAPPSKHAMAPCAVVGGLLVTGALLFGIREEVSAWPVACYPTFAALYGPERVELVCEADGRRIDPVRTLVGTTPASPHRLEALLRLPLSASDRAERDARLRAIWGVLGRADTAMEGTAVLRFYQKYTWLDPDGRQEHPARRVLVVEWRRGEE